MNYLNTFFPIKGIKGHDEYIKSYFLFTLVFEASIAIPSYDFILNSNCNLEDFNPVTRYAKILNYFADLSYEELMNYRTGDLKALIDLLAKLYDWPDYETTIKSHTLDDDTIMNMISSDILEVNQRVLRESIKMKSECNAQFTCVNLALDEIHVPVISRTSKGLRQFSQGYWSKEITERYKSFYDAWYKTSLTEDEEKYRQFLKLISEKLFRITILDTDLYIGGNYTCPMKEVECPHHCEWCNNIKNIHEIAEKTTNMDIKCMFADYLNSKEYIIPLSRKTRKGNY